MDRIEYLTEKYNIKYTKTSDSVKFLKKINLFSRVDIGLILLILIPLFCLIFIFKSYELDFTFYIIITLLSLLIIISLLALLKTSFDVLVIKKMKFTL